MLLKAFTHLRARYEEHLSRKIFHIFSGTIAAVLYADVFTREQSLWILGTLGSTLVVFDLWRLRWPFLNRCVLAVFGPVMREEEREGPSAQLFYVLGLFFCTILPKPIGIQAILTLAWMDPAAAIVGVKRGRTPWPRFWRGAEVANKKTVEGSFAGFVAAFLAGVYAWTGPWAAVAMKGGLYWPSPSIVAFLAIIGSFAAIFAEAFPTQWDDNATIPFWTGIVVWVAALFLPFPLQFG